MSKVFVGLVSAVIGIYVGYVGALRLHNIPHLEQLMLTVVEDAAFYGCVEGYHITKNEPEDLKTLKMNYCKIIAKSERDMLAPLFEK